MPSSHLNHQVHWWGGAQNGQNLIVLTSNSLTENEEHNIPSHIMKVIFGLHALVIF